MKERIYFMAKFTKTTNTNKTTNTSTETNTEKGKPRVTSCRLVNIEKNPGLIAFANVVFEGTVFMQNIAVRENREGDAYITFPSKKRMNKDGTAFLDENGKETYDNYYGPADSSTRKALQEMIMEAVQNKLDGKAEMEIEKGANKAIVNLVKGHDGLVAMVNVVFTGKFFMTGITVNEILSGEHEGTAYLGFPSRKRMKNGVEVMNDKTNKPFYDPYYGPGSPDAKKALEDMIYPAVQEEISKAEE